MGDQVRINESTNTMNRALIFVVFCLLFAQPGCRRQAAGVDSNSNSTANGVASDQPSEARALLEQGKQLYRDDQDTQALEVFQKAIKLDPDLAEAHFRLGLTFDGLGQSQEATDAYKKAIDVYKKYFSNEDNAKDAEAHYNMGQAYAGLQLYSDAVREYRQAIRLKEDDTDIYYDLGLALTRLAQYDEAAAAFEKAIEIDPENYRASDALEEAREGVKRIRAGKKHQEELLKKKKKEEELKKKEGQASPTTSGTPS